MSKNEDEVGFASALRAGVGLLGAVAGDVPLQGGFDDVGHLVAAFVHERERFVPHGSDADGADGCLSGRGSACHAKNVTQKSWLSTCVDLAVVPFLYYKNEARAHDRGDSA